MATSSITGITLKLTGEDGNAFVILAKAKAALRRNGESQERQTQFINEATSGDYDHLLATCMEWFDVE